MKTIGRGRDYQKALALNLVYNLARYRRIITTKAKAKLLQKIAHKRTGFPVRLTPVGVRKGDGATQVIVELDKKEDVRENKTNTGKRNSKKVASH